MKINDWLSNWYSSQDHPKLYIIFDARPASIWAAGLQVRSTVDPARFQGGDLCFHFGEVHLLRPPLYSGGRNRVPPKNTI